MARAVHRWRADRRSALQALAVLVVPGGQLSVTVRKGAALAFRTGLRRDSHAALNASGQGRHSNPEPVLAQIPALTPLGRLGQPADIADIADIAGMLARPDARWPTGQVIFATGGMA